VGFSRSVAGKVVLVTGAASGMGRAIADVFGAEGAKVAATDRNADDLPGTASWRLDVTSEDAITDVVDEIARSLGPIDVLVNCAGVSVPAPIDAAGYVDAWDTTLAVNLVGYVAMIRTSCPTSSANGPVAS
jgi:3-oxoacyl-[acyl-carrier protein] reductase